MPGKPLLKATIQLYEMQGGRCAYCLKKFDLNDKNKEPTFDHIEPKCKTHRKEDNFAIVCYDCNHKKSNISVEKFLDGYIAKHVGGHKFGLPSKKCVTLEIKVRGPRRWYHRWIKW